jgi:hypothetical protein
MNDTNAQPQAGQIAPGEEAGSRPQDTPYNGWQPGAHIGYPLNDSFWVGAQAGRY